jgi:hypothetical protein
MKSPCRSRFWLAGLLALGLVSACAHIPIDSQSSETARFDSFVGDVLQASKQLGPDRVLVAFDIDNTLLAMEQGLGSDQWYEWQKTRYEEDRCDPRVVADRLAVQGTLYFASAMRPTSADAADAVRQIQDQGIRVIALTSRGSDFRLQTFRELRRHGFDFRRSSIGPAAGWPEDFVPDNGTRPARYEDGVFLTAGQHKGAMLDALLRRAEHPLPAVILVLDDKQENLDAVTETFTRLGVPVRAWRFSGEDENVAGFNADESDALWQAIRPSLEALEQALGPDHYRLPADLRPADCP